ncbi:T9SS type A sorting domain-containing protein [Rufibacter roseolus]|uniref:T9SS type A sorting domain-containing protein n=1 Tax=Rufibacter roseolus TaxID=2817375 RepID=UPI001B307063|nr:T9SS type A sorting domain-containing protein [Rufibacter roseolus]
MKRSLLSLLLAVLCLSAGARQQRQQCVPVLTTQEEVDNFPKLTCEVIGLVIQGSRAPGGIRNLDALKSLTSVTGSVHLSLSGVESIEGLENLATVGGDFSISGMDEISSLLVDDFSALSSVGGQLNIRGNPGLTILHSFWKLRSAKTVDIGDNRRLEDVRGFPLFNTTTFFTISYCPSLADISGFDNLTSVYPAKEGEGSILYIGNNPALRTITGFKGLGKVDEMMLTTNRSLADIPSFNGLKEFNSIAIGSDSALVDISGFNGGFTEGGSLTISRNPKLRAVTGFNGLKAKTLAINSNEALAEIAGFDDVDASTINIGYHDNLVKISGFRNIGAAETLSITDNGKLETVSGFDRLKELKSLFISRNGSIATLAGSFPSLDQALLEQLSVNNNPRLSFCSAPWMCAFMRDNMRGNQVHSNAPGCQGPNEVLAGCNPLAAAEEERPAPPMFPNPTTGHLRFGRHLRFTIYDGLGRPVLKGEGEGVSVSALAPGVYVLRTGENEEKAYRFVKE